MMMKLEVSLNLLDDLFYFGYYMYLYICTIYYTIFDIFYIYIFVICILYIFP